jgi:hypothetical protein
MAMTLRSKLAVIAVIASGGVAVQSTILGSFVDRCRPTVTAAHATDRALWIANGAASPGVDWINLELEADVAPGSAVQPGPSGLPTWLEVPDLDVAAPERRVGTVALGWPVRWSFCQWAATDTEHFFPPMSETEEPCQSLRRAVNDWGRSADGAAVRSWVSVPGLALCWLTIAMPMALVVLVNRHSAGKSGKAT